MGGGVNRTRWEVTRQDGKWLGQAGFQVGGATGGSKSQGWTVKCQTCLIFCRSTTISQETITDLEKALVTDKTAPVEHQH